MARKYNKKKKSKKKYSELEKLAFQMGKVNKGLKNTNSKVYDSYNAGFEAKTSKRKPLY